MTGTDFGHCKKANNFISQKYSTKQNGPTNRTNRTNSTNKTNKTNQTVIAN
jgi:hypothetical protein